MKKNCGIQYGYSVHCCTAHFGSTGHRFYAYRIFVCTQILQNGSNMAEYMNKEYDKGSLLRVWTKTTETVEVEDVCFSCEEKKRLSMKA